jgi:hypothetical protein
MIGGLLKQFMTFPDIPEMVTEALWPKWYAPLDLDTACYILRIVLESFHRAYVCIDALDECDDDHRKVLLQLLARVTTDSTRLFLTSRPSVESDVNHYLGVKSPIIIQHMANKQDIEKYINHRIDEDNRPDLMNDSLRNEIVAKISAASQQMWVYGNELCMKIC